MVSYLPHLLLPSPYCVFFYLTYVVLSKHKGKGKQSEKVRISSFIRVYYVIATSLLPTQTHKGKKREAVTKESRDIQTDEAEVCLIPNIEYAVVLL